MTVDSVDIGPAGSIALVLMLLYGLALPFTHKSS